MRPCMITALLVGGALPGSSAAEEPPAASSGPQSKSLKYIAFGFCDKGDKVIGPYLSWQPTAEMAAREVGNNCFGRAIVATDHHPLPFDHELRTTKGWGCLARVYRVDDEVEAHSVCAVTEEAAVELMNEVEKKLRLPKAEQDHPFGWATHNSR